MPEYFPRDGMMLYASFTEGYKSGFIADQIVPSPAAPNGGVIPFNHENVETFELGLQLAATENLRFDASVGKLNHEIVRLDPSVAFKTDGGMPRSPEDSWKNWFPLRRASRQRRETPLRS